jgi:hypothetical protein
VKTVKQTCARFAISGESFDARTSEAADGVCTRGVFIATSVVRQTFVDVVASLKIETVM